MTPAELARQVKLLEITARHLVTEVFAGEYSSAFKGRGIEFADVREYQPGDDIRSIDWNVTARTGRPFVKRFNEERELTVMLCVDLSASGDFSTSASTKRELASQIAAVLAFAATKNNDRIGLVVFTDRVELTIPPAKGSRHALRIVRELLAFEPSGRATDFGVAADRVARTLNRRAVVFVLSDFVGHGVEDAWKQLSLRHDVVALHVSDPREQALPNVGLLHVQDPETGARTWIDSSSPRVRDAYRRRWTEHQDRLTSMFRRIRVDTVSLTTEKPYIHDLIEFFHTRESRRIR